MDRATAGALAASVYNAEGMHAGVMAGGIVKGMEVLPEPEEGKFTIAMRYDEFGDVRDERRGAPKEKTVALEYTMDELDRYRLPGIDGDVVHKQTLAKSLKEEKGHLNYDSQTESFLVMHHINEPGRYAICPGEVIGAEEFLTPAEHALIRGAKKHRKEWMDFFTADKVKGWETADFADLSSVKASRRTLDNLRENATELANEKAGTRLAETVKNSVETLVEGYRKRWADATFESAVKNLEMVMVNEPGPFLQGLRSALFGYKRPVDVKPFENTMRNAIDALAARLPVEARTDTRWMRRLEAIEGGKGRVEAQVEIHLSLPLNMPDDMSHIPDPRPGKDGQWIHVGSNFGSSNYSRTISAPMEMTASGKKKDTKGQTGEPDGQDDIE